MVPAPAGLAGLPPAHGGNFSPGNPQHSHAVRLHLLYFGLNLILAEFSDQAVTALGLYYKWQTIFFIPLGAMQTCIVPIVSFNYAARRIQRCKKTLLTAIAFGMALMVVGVLCFETIPGPMLRVFTSDERVVEIGQVGFRIIGISFLPMVTSLVFPAFFQAVGAAVKRSMLTVVRTVVLFVPLGALFAQLGLNWLWLTFPVTDTLTSLVGFWYYRQFLAHPYVREAPLADREHPAAVLRPSQPGVILTIAREHGSSGKEIGRRVAERLGVPFYYKEMTALAAQESGLGRKFISSLNRNAPKRLYNLYLSTRVVRLAVMAKHNILQCIADQGSCVIVGRAADYVLRERADVVRVFIHAPREYRIGRVAGGVDAHVEGVGLAAVFLTDQGEGHLQVGGLEDGLFRLAGHHPVDGPGDLLHAEGLHQDGGPVGGAVVHHDDLVELVLQTEQGTDGGDDGNLLVVGGHHNGHGDVVLLQQLVFRWLRRLS